MTAKGFATLPSGQERVELTDGGWTSIVAQVQPALMSCTMRRLTACTAFEQFALIDLNYVFYMHVMYLNCGCVSCTLFLFQDGGVVLRPFPVHETSENTAPMVSRRCPWQVCIY